jgi:hypothetical protein
MNVTRSTHATHSRVTEIFSRTRRNCFIGGLCLPLTSLAFATHCESVRKPQPVVHRVYSIEDVLAVTDIAALFTERAMTGLDFADLSCIVRENQANVSSGSRMHVASASVSVPHDSIGLQLDNINSTLSGLSSRPLRACLAVLVCEQNAPVVSLARATHTSLQTMVTDDGLYACAAVNALPGEATRIALLTVHR